MLRNQILAINSIKAHGENNGWCPATQLIVTCNFISDNKILNTIALKKPNIVLREKGQIYRLGWREPGLRDGIYKAEIILDYEDKIAPVTEEIEFQFSGDMIQKLETVKAGD